MTNEELRQFFLSDLCTVKFADVVEEHGLPVEALSVYQEVFKSGAIAMGEWILRIGGYPC